jgi:RNA polymerase sigma-70 factor, ECF subfamily
MALSMEESNPTKQATQHAHYSNQSVLAEALVNQQYPYLYRLAFSILGDADEADDAVQETILKALAHWKDGLKEPEQRRWLTVLAVNHCRDRLRRQKVRIALVDILGVLHLARTHEASTEEMFARKQDRSTLWQCVQDLDEKHRLPVILRFVHGLSAAEISQALSIQEGTVYSRLHYAIHQLRERLEKAFEEGEAE